MFVHGVIVRENTDKKGEQHCRRRDRHLCCHLLEMRSFYGHNVGQRIEQALHFEAMTIITFPLMCLALQH